MPLTEEEVIAMIDQLSNWGRWGEDDEGGTLNLLGPSQVREAMAAVRDGIRVCCSRKLAPRPTKRPGSEFLHKMQASGEAAPEAGSGVATDWFAIGFHGFEHTHLDSLSHVFWNRKMYNNRASELCTTERGALFGGVEPAFAGIVGRGLLFDAPVLKSKPWLEPGEALFPEDFDAWFARQGLTPRPGDMLWVRTGRDAWEDAGRAVDLGVDGSPGLDPACLPWLREHDISVLLSDVANDARPCPYKLGRPIHVVGIVAMGLWLVDNAAMGELSRTARQVGRYEFLSLICPLAMRRATGCPVNPVAVF